MRPSLPQATGKSQTPSEGSSKSSNATPPGDDSVGRRFQKFGSIAFGEHEADGMKDLAAMGFTGETYADFDRQTSKADPICIVHFNDVYNIDPGRDENGGISRFITALRELHDRNPLILFSGDVFNPSILSTNTKGRHMVPFLNMLKIHTACFGNHDFDFGLDHLEYLAGSTRFPWLLSNVFDAAAPDMPLAGIRYRLCEWQGNRIGLIGLVEHEWLTTLATIDEDEIVYRDFVEVADELCELLRSKECDLIIALTHMRAPNDERLAKECSDIDLILGGHDHEYFGCWTPEGARCPIVKSGTDFREFSVCSINPRKKPPTGAERDVLGSTVPMMEEAQSGVTALDQAFGGCTMEWKRVVVSIDRFRTNRHVDAIVEKYMKELAKQMDCVLGETQVDLETRFSKLRTEETNAGNWFTDMMRKNTKADIALLNSGTIRSDCVFGVGIIRIRDLNAMLPMADELVVIEVKGSQIRRALENSVSQWPKTEGRFLQVSGLKFAFDGTKPAGARVLRESVQVQRKVCQPWCLLDDDAKYSLITKKYLQIGRDGFDMLVDSKVLLDEEACPNLPTMIRNSFSVQALANGFHKARTTGSMRRLGTMKALDADALQAHYGLAVQSEGEKQVFRIHCQVEGRIVAVGD